MYFQVKFGKKILVLLLLIVFGFGTCLGEQVTIDQAVPVFETPDFQSKILGVSSRPFPAEKLEEQIVLVTFHPLSRYHRLGKVKLPDDKIGYVNPNVVVTSQGKLRSGLVLEWWRFTLVPLYAGVLVALSLVLWKQHPKPDP